jgi:hypothetical protein
MNNPRVFVRLCSLLGHLAGVNNAKAVVLMVQAASRPLYSAEGRGGFAEKLGGIFRLRNFFHKFARKIFVSNA